MRPLAALIVVALALVAQPALAARPISIAVVTEPGISQSIAAEKFRDIMAQEAPEKFNVTVSYGHALGGEGDMLMALRSGRIHLAVITVGAWDRFAPMVRVLEYPFLFDNYSEVDKVIGGEIGQVILDSLARAGYKGLAFSENGFRNLTNNKRPVHSQADVVGLRLRTMRSIVQKEIWTRLGADVVAHPWPIKDFLREGGADGEENPLNIIWGYRLDEVQTYLTLTRHVYSGHILAADLSWFQALPLEDQKLLTDMLRRAAAYQRAQSRAAEQQALLSLQDSGMEVVENPDRDSFKDKLDGMADLPMFQAPGLPELLEQARKLVD